MRLAWGLSGLAFLGGGLLLRRWPALADALPPCAMRATLHIGCPTCGFTRALAALVRGDLASSLALHPLALPVALELGMAWLVWGVGLELGRPAPRARTLLGVVALNVIVALATWIVRLALGTIPA